MKVSALESASCAEPVKKPVKAGTLSVEVRELRAEIEALKKRTHSIKTEGEVQRSTRLQSMQGSKPEDL